MEHTTPKTVGGFIGQEVTVVGKLVSRRGYPTRTFLVLQDCNDRTKIVQLYRDGKVGYADLRYGSVVAISAKIYEDERAPQYLSGEITNIEVFTRANRFAELWMRASHLARTIYQMIPPNLQFSPLRS